MLQIYIDQITDTGWVLDERVDAQALPLPGTISRDAGVHLTTAVRVRLRAVPADEAVLIDGSIECVVRIPCSRCLEPFDLDLKTEFSITAVPPPPARTDTESTDEIELTADEMNVLVYDGPCIDLKEEVAQQFIMALPIKPLCRETCQGLCSRCGADLNKGPCRCHVQDHDSPFAMLKTIPFPNKKV